MQSTFSKTTLAKRIALKRDPRIVETLIACKHHPAWMPVAKILAQSRKNLPEVNLQMLDEKTKEGDLAVVPGKVLGQGDVSKKIRVIALQFSASAKEKLRAQKSEVATLLEEIKINPKAEGITIFT